MLANNLTSDNSMLKQLIEDKCKGLESTLPSVCMEHIIESLVKLEEVSKKQVNRFPFEVFPPEIQKIIKATNEDLEFPIDFIGASMLYAVSVSIGNTFKVEIKKGFFESAVLYLALVGRPGINKSHPLTFALKPIIDQDTLTYKIYEQENQEYERLLNLSKSEKKKHLIDEAKKPFWKKILLSDYTPEALAEVHKFNKRGIGVYIDELAGWFKNFNRYNRGSEMEFWLSAWNSKPINIDRKTGEPVFIPTPFISVGGTIQTGILNELAKDTRTQNGFIDRILFVIPEDLQKTCWSESEIDQSTIDNWKYIILKLLAIPIHYDDTLCVKSEILNFTPEAKRSLYDWQKLNTDQCNDAENDAISGIYSKLDMYAARLALIIEMMNWACNESQHKAISIESVNGAIKLIEYFRISAIKVNSIITNLNPIDKLPANKLNLYNELPDTFTTEIGLQIALRLGIAERTYRRFLNNKELFNKLKQGEYEKQI